jgi:hypothetical protein
VSVRPEQPAAGEGDPTEAAADPADAFAGLTGIEVVDGELLPSQRPRQRDS